MTLDERKNMISILHFRTGQPEHVFEKMSDEALEREYQIRCER
ncbi:hypothetical protein ACFFJY_09230 [Fictibacillus aquaticus]